MHATSVSPAQGFSASPRPVPRLSGAPVPAVWAVCVVLAGVPLLSLGMTACGSSADDEPSPAATSAGTSSATDELVISVRDASGATRQWRLTCRPPGGDHPDPEQACRVLEQNGTTALPAVPKDRMCTQVYGGPETATITGTWRGKPVASRLSRVNGCETSRWNSLAGLLPRAGS